MQTHRAPDTRSGDMLSGHRPLRVSLIGLGVAAILLVGGAPPAPTATANRSSTTTIVTSQRPGAVDRTDRRSVAAAYRDRLLPMLASPNAWNHDVAVCRPGTVDPVHQRATLDTVNWFRDFVGLEPISFDPVLDAKAQKAALMMDANGRLSHDPDPSWSCHSADGVEAAGRSNLFLGVGSGPLAIAGYIADPGPNNTAVGHRRWILDPTRLTMGSGTTSRANALWVLGATRPMPADPPVVAWPPSGFFPVRLEPGGRWSLSIPRADFGSSSVTVRDDRGISYGITVHAVAPNRGQNTLAWNIVGLDIGPGMDDRRFTVTVTGIRNWTRDSYSYDVTIFDPS